MLRKLVATLMTEKQKRFLRRQASIAKAAFVRRYRQYDGQALEAALRGLGIRETDTLLVHANLRADSGFRGTPHDLVSALIAAVGIKGNLLMVSQPFRGYAYDYLLQGKPFHAARTVSMMGLVTEMFRRRSGTLRSLHPTHPVLAYGVDAARLVAGHENCLFPCGTGTPFETFRQMNGKILFFDVGSGANTFFHHVEALIKDRLPFALYDERLFEARVIDAEQRPHVVRTHAFARGVIRRTDRLEEWLTRRQKMQRRRVGNSDLLLVDSKEVVDAMTQMVDSGEPLFERAVQ